MIFRLVSGFFRHF